jgi:hypothetical protein
MIVTPLTIEESGLGIGLTNQAADIATHLRSLRGLQRRK